MLDNDKRNDKLNAHSKNYHVEIEFVKILTWVRRGKWEDGNKIIFPIMVVQKNSVEKSSRT